MLFAKKNTFDLSQMNANDRRALKRESIETENLTVYAEGILYNTLRPKRVRGDAGKELTYE